MASSTAMNLAIFGVGAVLGAGVTATITSRRQVGTALIPPNVSHPTQVGPIIEVGPKGATPHIVKSTALTTTTPSTVLKYGNPGPIPDFLSRQAYAAAYDRRLRHPAWTAEHLTLASLGKSSTGNSDGPKGNRESSQFKEDEDIPVTFRARMADYFRSGYDRGHMVPAADAKISQSAMDETFLLTNIAPQVGAGFNRHYWAYLEDWCRRQTSTFQDVFVFTIPLYLPKQGVNGKWHVSYEVIGNPVPNVSVPTHFAKVVLGSRPSSPSNPNIQELSLGAFVLPNAEIPDEAPLTSFVVPVDSVERAAGLTLFSDVIKNSAKNICQTSKCEVIVRRFDDAAKSSARKGLPAPKQ